jgi:uncharacterized protein YjiS (DUF1127 family)
MIKHKGTAQMAFFDTTRTAYGTSSAASRISAFVAQMAVAVVAWNDARVTRRALTSLSDRELEDIGLTRGDIEVVADSNMIR